jgi:hypothetical protein
LSHFGCDLTCTDLPKVNNYSDWLNVTAGKKSDFYYEELAVERKIFDQRITFKEVDMNNLPKDILNNSYDFLWSTCSIEHLGSIGAGFNFILNSLKCLKKGGFIFYFLFSIYYFLFIIIYYYLFSFFFFLFLSF